jgi:hypothetical protein
MCSFVVVLAACGGGGGFPPDAAIDSPPPGGRFSLAWSVTDTDAQPIDCKQVGAQVVSIGVRNLAGAGGSTEAFTCNSLMGTSGPLTPGFYELTFSLTGLAGELATAPSVINVELKSGDTTTLDPITFAVDAVGGLEIVLQANQPGGNCASELVSPPGAGITDTTITLTHADGTCEPVTFAISTGGTYTVDCANPALGPCFENTIKLTAPTLPSGDYRIHVRGKRAAVDCWSNDDSLAIPPLQKTLQTTLNLAKADGC